jgi:hypothetical protein
MGTKLTTARLLAGRTLALGVVLACAGTARAETPPAAPADSAAQTTAPAPTGESCSAAYERSQTEKVAGHYVAATAAALECSQLGCNPAIVRECVRFYESLQQDTPTLVFSARKGEGGELAEVRVEMDGKPIVQQITGRPYAVDPGSHDFVFIHPTRGRMELTETARVGDHARVMEVTFADPNAKAAPPPGTPAADVKPGPAVPVMAWVLGGVGVAGLGTFVLFRVSAVSDYNEYNSTCSPACNPADIDAVHRKFMISYASLGVGVAGLVGAGLVFALTPRRHGNEVQASVVPHRDGALVGLKARF